MRTKVDDRLRREAVRFSLRFACEDCAHLDGRGRCSLGYPAAPRLDALDAPELELCKSFELA